MSSSESPRMRRRWPWPRRRWQSENIERAAARHHQIAGWDQDAYSAAVALFIGAGGANGEVVEGAGRKGIGTAHVADLDTVDPTNLNRQKFTRRDLWKNKAVCLCRNLSRQCALGTRFIAHPCWYQDLRLDEIRPDIVVCSVDQQVEGTRLTVSRACHDRGIPCVFFAVSTDTDWGYVFVQQPGAACWACMAKPDLADPDVGRNDLRCPGAPACCDILKALAGHALYAMDTLVMHRPRDWNYRAVSLSRSDFGASSIIQPRRGCPVCG